MKRLTCSGCFHLLLLHGLTARACLTPSDAAGEHECAAIEVLFDEQLAKRYLGKAALVRTRTGLRFPTDRHSAGLIDSANESHRDQGLATLGAVGVPVSRLVSCAETSYSVRDILQDAVANFDLNARELEWTTIAFLFYLHPRAMWTNRFGASFSFNDLAKELLSRRLEESSCGGTHLLSVFSALLDVDNDEHMLSAPVRSALQTRLRRHLLTVTARQGPGGQWESYDDLRSADRSVVTFTRHGRDSLRSGQAATAHIVLWLRTLPAQFEVRDEVYARAAGWLRTSLSEVEPEDFWIDVCTATHVLAVLKMTGTEVPEEYASNFSGSAAQN